MDSGPKDNSSKSKEEERNLKDLIAEFEKHGITPIITDHENVGNVIKDVVNVISKCLEPGFNMSFGKNFKEHLEYLSIKLGLGGLNGEGKRPEFDEIDLYHEEEFLEQVYDTMTFFKTFEVIERVSKEAKRIGCTYGFPFISYLWHLHDDQNLRDTIIFTRDTYRTDLVFTLLLKYDQRMEFYDTLAKNIVRYNCEKEKMHFALKAIKQDLLLDYALAKIEWGYGFDRIQADSVINTCFKIAYHTQSENLSPLIQFLFNNRRDSRMFSDAQYVFKNRVKSGTTIDDINNEIESLSNLSKSDLKSRLMKESEKYYIRF